MIHDTLATFATALAPGRPLIGLDLGTRTIGIAISDTRRVIASPEQVIRRTKFTRDARELYALVQARDVTGIIIGLPLNMDGSEGPRAQATRAFARNLVPVAGLPIAFWDERLSTVAAERALIEADLSRRHRGTVIDAVAAGYILQGALDRLQQGIKEARD